MNILLAGATGFIGQALIQAWKEAHQVTVLGREEQKLQRIFPHLSHMTWAQLDAVDPFDAVINLAGENIGQGRWTTRRKQAIVGSRVKATERLALLCARAKQPPRLLNASAIGVYGLSKPPQIFDEYSHLPNPPQDFLAVVGAAWEGALAVAEQAHVSVVRMRFGVVLAEHGGALAKMLPAFKLGLGGPIGSGNQAFSWIALEDIVRAITFLLAQPDINGPVNIVAPEIVTQKQFAKALGKALHRPACFPLPAWLVKLQFGQMGEELLLKGAAVKSQKLADAGFVFSSPSLAKAFF